MIDARTEEPPDWCTEDLSSLDDDYAADEGRPGGSAGSKPFNFTLLENLEPNLKSQFVIKDFLPRGALGCCYAHPGAGKTAIIIDMVLHVAVGREYRGRRVEKQVVGFVALEGHGGIGNRVIAAARHLGIEQAPFGVVTANENFRDPETAAKTAATVQAIRAKYDPEGNALDNPVIVIDTFQAALGPRWIRLQARGRHRTHRESKESPDRRGHDGHRYSPFRQRR